jgi:hypothetical protein
MRSFARIADAIVQALLWAPGLWLGTFELYGHRSVHPWFWIALAAGPLVFVLVGALASRAPAMTVRRSVRIALALLPVLVFGIVASLSNLRAGIVIAAIVIPATLAIDRITGVLSVLVRTWRKERARRGWHADSERWTDGEASETSDERRARRATLRAAPWALVAALGWLLVYLAPVVGRAASAHTPVDWWDVDSSEGS